jgi:hypothetical protein
MRRWPTISVDMCRGFGGDVGRVVGCGAFEDQDDLGFRRLVDVGGEECFDETPSVDGMSVEGRFNFGDVEGTGPLVSLVDDVVFVHG